SGESLWKEAGKRLLRDKVALFGGIVIVLLVAISVLAPVISPHDPNKQYPDGTTSFGMPLPIGAHGKLLTLTLASAPERTYTVPSTVSFVSADQQNKYSIRVNVTFEAGQKQATVDANPVSPDMAKAPDQLQVTPVGEDLSLLSIPIAAATLTNAHSFPLGSDASGRDVLSRLIYGAQVSLLVGVVAIVNPAEIQFFQLTSKVGLTPEVIFICIAISVVSWTQYARLVRSQVLTVREQEYVEASRSLGATDSHIMFRHILPNVTAPVIVVATMGIASAIMTEASLSFLGFGVKVPTASWGSMINESLGYFSVAPWIPLIPGLAIAITVFAFNLFGDGVRDALDPRLK
ncbi:MAG: hypothetical protein CVV27_07695, partial [Candidatus Melainabacteria bacterium HGW-Melainabacteria-1]